jgi:hypothetical protein
MPMMDRRPTSFDPAIWAVAVAFGGAVVYLTLLG